MVVVTPSYLPVRIWRFRRLLEIEVLPTIGLRHLVSEFMVDSTWCCAVVASVCVYVVTVASKYDKVSNAVLGAHFHTCALYKVMELGSTPYQEAVAVRKTTSGPFYLLALRTGVHFMMTVPKRRRRAQNLNAKDYPLPHECTSI